MPLFLSSPTPPLLLCQAKALRKYFLSLPKRKVLCKEFNWREFLECLENVLLPPSMNPGGNATVHGKNFLWLSITFSCYKFQISSFSVLQWPDTFWDNGFPLALLRGCKEKWSNRSKHFVLHLQVTICKSDWAQLDEVTISHEFWEENSWEENIQKHKIPELNSTIWAAGGLPGLPLGLHLKTVTMQTNPSKWF